MIRSGVLASFLFVMGGCSIVAPLDEVQCRNDDDCAEAGHDELVCARGLCVEPDATPKPNLPPQWQCATEIVPRDLSVPDVVIRYIDSLTSEPLADVALKVCSVYDPDCKNPKAEATTTADGTVTLDLDVLDEGTTTGRNFVLSNRDGFVPTRSYSAQWRPARGQLAAMKQHLGISRWSTYIAMSKPELLQMLADLTEVELASDAGMLVLSAQSCDVRTGAGARFGYSNQRADTRIAYFKGALPSLVAAETDTLGLAAVVNVRPGLLTLTAVVAEDAYPIGQGQSVHVDAGWITAVSFQP